MLQIISSLSDSYDIMCGEGKMGIKALKEGLPCLDSARRYGYCDSNLTMQMNMFFKKLMRYQITSSTSCAPLAAFTSCLMANAKIQKPACKAEAQHALRQALDSWMYNLCTRVGYSVHVENWMKQWWKCLSVTAGIISSHTRINHKQFKLAIKNIATRLDWWKEMFSKLSFTHTTKTWEVYCLIFTISLLCYNPVLPFCNLQFHLVN